MKRLLSALTATAMTACFFTALAAATPIATPVRTLTTTAEGKPILLKRMVVTAAALPN